MAAFFIGFQILLRELCLLTGRYNISVGKAQSVTYVSSLVSLALMFHDVCFCSITVLLVFSAALLTFIFFAEFVLSRMNTLTPFVSWTFRFAYVGLISYLISSMAYGNRMPFFPFVLMGVYLRNVTFGIPHKKDLCLEYLFSRKTEKVISEQDAVDYCGEIPDFSYAGCKRNTDTQIVFNVKDYGILPGTNEDLTSKVQDLINKVGREGGGHVFFPKGRYLFNKSRGNFLQINYSNIHIEGETDSNGHLLTELVSCGPTSCGKKNPWLSPFFITTGEALQPSNEFFGLQFRKRKIGFSQSNSLSDPGSDGSILTPEYCTSVIEESPKGSRLLRVADSSKVGRYIMLGLYNTSLDGNLIKDILGVEKLRPEWKTALRAGVEEAPSYQWLVEVSRIVDGNTIELARPLLRSCDMVYEPAVFNVAMLENITIGNLRLNSKWNGMFRHHGFPLYYSIAESQEMDYGWNAINMKRVAHAKVYNLEIVNFTNPIYVLDSRNVTVKDISVSGYDGHQGIKIYQHACDCLFQNIAFYNHFADMLGGEGNAYGNVFSGIRYLNPSFHPVDFDFHGFGEGPMSPPSDNLFECVTGFRCIKSAGALYNLPSCAQNNIWWNIITEGERKGGPLFYAMTYREKKGALRLITAIGFAVAMIQKNHIFSFKTFVENIRAKLNDIDRTGIEAKQHYMFFKNSHVIGVKTANDIDGLDDKTVKVSHVGETCRPFSIYGQYLQHVPV